MSLDISLSRISSSVTFEGIEQAVSSLNYSNPNILKYKYLHAVMRHYSSQEDVERLTQIDQDSLIREIWNIDDDIQAVRAKRKNLNSIRSTVNADLNKLYEKGDNPEGITINTQNIFSMSDQAKSDKLNEFSHSVRSDSQIDLEAISEVLNMINDFISKQEGLERSEATDDAIEKIKQILEGLDGLELKKDDDFEGIDEDEVEILDDEDFEEVEEIEDEDLEEIDEDEIEELEEEPEDVEDEDLEEIDEDEVDIVDDEDVEEVEDDELEEIDEDEVDIVDDDEIEEVEDDELEDLDEIDDEELEEIDDDEVDIVDDDEIEEVEDEDLEEIDDEDVDIVDEDEIDEVDDDEIEEIEDDELEDIDDEIEEIDDDDVDIIDEDDLEELEDESGFGGAIETGIPDDGDAPVISDNEKNRMLAEQFVKHLGTIDRYYSSYLNIPEGSYTIGSPEPKRHEIHAHPEWVRAFYIGKFPITNSLFEVFANQTGYRTTAERVGHGIVYSGRYKKQIDKKSGQIRSVWKTSHSYDVVKGASWYHPNGPSSSIAHKLHHPVVQVSQEDALAFASWIGKSLPTEIQWEAASRTMKGLTYPWGNQWMLHACNMEDSAVSDTTPVDHYLDFMNEYHVADLVGNVLEWTADVIPSPYKNKARDTYSIAKGGSFISNGPVPLWTRFIYKEGYTSNIVGFRCAVM